MLVLNRAKQFIQEAIAKGGRVLVHCNGGWLLLPLLHCTRCSGLLCVYAPFADMRNLGGISLSPSFVVMFVMQHYQLSWEDALHMVQNRRYCISPNGGFLTQIKVRLFFFSQASTQYSTPWYLYRNTKRSTKPV
jgi:serine/threonine/tyrosine-interacting protein